MSAPHVTRVWPLCLNMLHCAFPSLTQQHPECRNTSRQGSQMVLRYTALKFWDRLVGSTLRWSSALHFFLQFKFKIFHTFSYFVHQLRLSCELTSWPAPSWLDSSVGRELGKTQAWKYRLTLSGSVLRELVLTIDFAFLMTVLSEGKLNSFLICFSSSSAGACLYQEESLETGDKLALLRQKGKRRIIRAGGTNWQKRETRAKPKN